MPTIWEQEGNEKKNIPIIWEREGNEKKTFPKFRNGKGKKKSIPIIWEHESEAVILGNGREREFPLTPGKRLWHMKHEKVRKCGKESLVPVIMAMDSLAAGSDTTGFILNMFCLNLLNLDIFSQETLAPFCSITLRRIPTNRVNYMM